MKNLRPLLALSALAIICVVGACANSEPSRPVAPTLTEGVIPSDTTGCGDNGGTVGSGGDC